MSVRKRKWKTTKGEEREAWVVDYVDQDDERHIETFEKKGDAIARHSMVNVRVADGVHVAPSKSKTIREAGKSWIEFAKQGDADTDPLERSTIAQYEQHLRLHIEPLIGAMKLSDLTVSAVRAFGEALREKGVSIAMRRKILTSLGTLIADAQSRSWCAHNAVRDLSKRRRVKRSRQSKKRHEGKLEVGVHIPTPEEARMIVAYAKGRWRPLLITAIFTGLRASELRGLRWKDVDFKKNELHVRQRADRFYEIGKPKSLAGVRVVPFGPFVANTLKEWKLACPKGDLDLVFPNSTGKIEAHSIIINRGLIPAQIEAGLMVDGKAKYTGLHALRHFYASWCINRVEDGGLGLPPKVVQTRLGHSSITMTMDTYGHLFPRGDDTKELAAAERALLA